MPDRFLWGWGKAARNDGVSGKESPMGEVAIAVAVHPAAEIFPDMSAGGVSMIETRD